MLLVALFLVSGWSAAAEIEPQLAAKLGTLSSSDYVRVIVRMEEQPFVAASMGADAVRFMLKDAAARTQAPVLEFFSQRQSQGDVLSYNSFWLANVAFAEIRADVVDELAALPGVAYVYEDFEISAPPRFGMDDVMAQQEPLWDSYASTYAPEVWEMGFTGKGVTVAVTDTGIDISHPELAGAMGGSPPFHEGYWAEMDSNGNLVPGSMPHDTDYHGTHVAGTAVGRSVGDHTVGMAPEATLAGVIVIPAGNGSFPQVIGGLQWVAEQKFDVVNGSWGANIIHQDLAVATDNLAAAGVVPVFSNGNWSPLEPDSFPPGVRVDD